MIPITVITRTVQEVKCPKKKNRAITWSTCKKCQWHRDDMTCIADEQIRHLPYQAGTRWVNLYFADHPIVEVIELHQSAPFKPISVKVGEPCAQAGEHARIQSFPLEQATWYLREITKESL